MATDSRLAEPKILIVAENAASGEELSGRLKRLGCGISGLASGWPAALDLARRANPDLLLVDAAMGQDPSPVGNAWDQLGLPLVVLAESAEIVDIARFGRTPPVEYLAGSFSDRELYLTIELTLCAARLDARNRAAEEARRKNDAMFNAVFDAAKDSIFIKDRDSRYVRVNHALAGMFGIAPEDMIGRTDEVLFGETHCREMVAEDAFILSGGVLNKEKNFLVQGRWRYFDTIKFPWTDETGQVLGICGFARDITKRKTAEEALQREKNRFEALVSRLPVGVALLGPDDAVEFASPRVFEIFDLDPARPLDPGWVADPGLTDPAGGRSWTDWLHAKRLGQIGQPDTRSFAYARPVGTPKTIRCRSVVLEDDRQFLIFTDDAQPAPPAAVESVGLEQGEPTDLSLLKEALRECERRYRRLFDDAVVGIFRATVDGRQLMSNQAHARIFGYESPEEFLATVKNAKELLVHPENRSQLIQKLADTNGPVELVNLYRRRDGGVFTGNLHIWAVKDEQGRVEYLEGFIEDISERKKTEERLRQALREKEALLSEIHHRVKNNMQVVSSLLELQSRRIKSPEDLDVFRESLTRVNSMALIHELLYQSDNFAEIDLARYVSQLAHSLNLSYRPDRDSVTMVVDVGSVTVGVDQAVPCGLAINELLTNAFKHGFTGRPGGEIRVRGRQNDDGLVEIAIRDNGAGLDPDLDWRSLNGLGLKLVIGLVESQLNGQVSLDRDNGTQFTIRFPRMQRTVGLPDKSR